MSKTLEELKEEFLATQELKHFGVKGMKWGKRKAEKPVSAEKQAKRDTKAQKFQNKASDLQKQYDSLTEQQTATKSAYSRREIEKFKTEVMKQKVTALKDAKASEEGRLTSTQKKVIIGASVVAAVIATKVIIDKTESGDFNRLAIKGNAFFKGEKNIEFAKNAKLADKSLGVDDIHDLVVKKINPDYGGIGTKMNCRRCTFSYEMRRRGYDVMATKTTNASGQNGAGLYNAINPDKPQMRTSLTSVISRSVKEHSARSKDYKAFTPLMDITAEFPAGGKNKILSASPKTIFETLANQPNGARGELGIQYRMGGGHSMIYEIINNKPVIFDGQTGKKFTDASEMISSNFPDLATAGFTRLDDIPLNVDYLLRWMQNAK